MRCGAISILHLWWYFYCGNRNGVDNTLCRHWTALYLMMFLLMVIYSIFEIYSRTMVMTTTTIRDEDENKSQWKWRVGKLVLFKKTNFQWMIWWIQEDGKRPKPVGQLDQAAGGLQQEDDVPLHTAGAWPWLFMNNFPFPRIRGWPRGGSRLWPPRTSLMLSRWRSNLSNIGRYLICFRVFGWQWTGTWRRQNQA